MLDQALNDSLCFCSAGFPGKELTLISFAGFSLAFFLLCFLCPRDLCSRLQVYRISYCKNFSYHL